MQPKPAWTTKVQRGMWMIVARSATLWSAENGGPDLEPEDKEAILAAGRYAEHHWGRLYGYTPEEDDDGSLQQDQA